MSVIQDELACDPQPGETRDPAGIAGTISFAEHFASPARFQSLYTGGMMLVEETATYLDGEGRRTARTLGTDLSLAYATESMRLTTRLMNISTWLLIRRAFNAREISAEDAEQQRRKVRLDTIARPSHVRNFTQLPERLQHLVHESYRLLDAVRNLEVITAADREARMPAPQSPVAAQFERIRTAFNAA